MLSKKEKKILRLIKYLPFLVIICLVLLISIIYIHNNNTYNEDIANLKKNFIKENKKLINSEVNKVHKYIVYKKSNSENRLKESIKNRVDEVHSIMSSIYKKYKDKESKEQITQRIKELLNNYRYNNNKGYFYINNLNGFNISHPLNPSLEGINIKDIKDKKGNSPVLMSINSLKNKDAAFTTVYWGRDNDLNNEYKRINYNKLFKPYNWFIGTGEYIIDFEKDLKSKILSYLNTHRYKKNGYVFILDYEGEYLAHLKKEYRGLNRINFVDKNGVEITKDIIKTAKNGEGYVTYMGTVKPEPNFPSLKTTYVKGFDDWNWALGSGFYHYELEKALEVKELALYNNNKEELQYLLTISIIFVLIFSLISFYISKLLKKQFLKYREEVFDHIEKSRKKDNILAQQSKMAAMGEMLENIAHQWRQPLSLISTISSSVKLNKESGLLSDDNLISSMDRITKSTTYLSQTIDDFSDFFNPNKEVTLFNLNETINKALKLLEGQFKDEKIKIIRNIEHLDIYGYKNEFIQVIINICNNAKDELIKSKVDEKIIIVEVMKKDNGAHIIIKDNAGGINENIIDRVFEPYFTTKDKSQGTGIGLHMSREIIVKHMKGSLTVRNNEFTYNSKKYKGAVFEITLKLS